MRVDADAAPAAALVGAVAAADADAEWTDAHDIVVCTDAHAYPDKVLVAIRRRTASCVIAIPKAEYDGLALAQLLGFKQAKTDPMARAMRVAMRA
ncbi:MAG: hypothetical protein WCJ87_12250 [Burkholderiales bacterium]